ncbi:hypothetical protein D3C76_763290 [compost metagenome]
MQVDKGKITAKISNVWVNESINENNYTIRLLLRNTSTATVTIPKYEFELQAAEGYRLPITSPIGDKMTLQGLEEKYVTLNLSLPKIEMVNPQLFMNMPPAAESKDVLNYLVGVFDLPQSQQMQNMIGQSQSVQTKTGTLGVTLSAVQKLPWIDGDLVTAKITINNPGYKTAVLPELTGEMKLDSASLGSDVKLISTQSVNVLGGGMSADLYVMAKLPKQLNFQQLQVSLMEKIGESSSEWVQFNQSGLTGLPTVSTGTSRVNSTQGKKEETKVLRTYVYSSAANNLIYTELEVKNGGYSQVTLPQYTGMYQGSNGQTYAAQASQIETSVGPEEKSVVALWAKVPKKIEVSSLKLIVGEGIKDSKVTDTNKDLTGYVNAAAYELSAIQPIVKSNLSEMELFPYTLTVRGVRASLTGSSSVNVNFEYKHTKNSDYLIGESSHKYLFELVDSSGRIYETEYTPEKDIKITESGTMSFSFNDSIFETRTYGTYKLNVYDLFQDQKLLIGSQSGYYSSSGYINEMK